MASTLSPQLLTPFATQYAQLLLNGSLTNRLAHHFAHVAPEAWLAMECALLFNSRCNDLGLNGWSVAVENKRVDLTLIPPIPPDYDRSAEIPDGGVFIEFKLVGTEWWKDAWAGAATDLMGKPKKPKADYVVCLLYNILKTAKPNRRSDTERLYSNYIASVPHSAGEFTPMNCSHAFYLFYSSEAYALSWDRPVFRRYPHGFSASMRFVWVTSAHKNPT